MTNKKRNSILLADSSGTDITELTQLLSPDYTIHTEKHGENTVRAAEKHNPDAIIITATEPETDGNTLIAELKKNDKTKFIPIIVIAPNANPTEEEKYLTLGAVDYISKHSSPVRIKLRLKNQINMLAHQRKVEYEIMNYKLMIESMNIALWNMEVLTPVLKSVEDPNIWIWSQELRQMLGFTDENDFPNTLGAFIARFHPEDAKGAVAAFINHFNDRTGKTPYDIEYRLRHKNGEYRHFDGYGTTLRDSDGVPIRVSGAIRDITEKKLIERQIVEASENMVLILESLPVGVRVVSQEDGRLLYANKALVEILGGKDCTEEISGRSIFEFMPEIQPNGRKTTDIVDEFVKTDRATLDFQCIRLDGELFMARVYSCNINYMGHISSLAVIEDLTEKNRMIETARRAEIAEESSKAKSQFLATMSHEIRTPMNSIMGFAELALDTAGIAPQVKDYLSKISDNAGWLLKIINDILDISKIEAGRMELEKVPFSLSDVFSRCHSVMLPEAKEKGLDLRVYAEPPIGKQLLGDPIRLYQILINLLSNAMKFTDTGTIWFSSAIVSSDSGPPTSGPDGTPNKDGGSATIYFEVKDSGIGMTPEQTQRIFEPFIQADSSTTRNYGGTGLGLAIVKNIVELMGGQLSVDSTPGTGSKFSFEIEFDTIKAPEEQPGIEVFAPLERPYFEALVLVCDDNRMNQEVICEHLSRVGIQAESAENGKEGVNMVMERIINNEPPYDMVFMDMFMPVMDGIEAATRIAELDTGTPIVAMTANVMTSELERYKKHGMPHCLGKPFSSQELMRILLKYLSPVRIDVIDEQEGDNEELEKSLRINFVKNNLTMYNEIEEAVAAGDITLAHRLAHTLKGSAGLIGKNELKDAAAEVELILKDGIASVWESKMNLLKTELDTVIKELKPLIEQPVIQDEPQPISAEEALAILEKLAPLLENINPESAEMLNDIRLIPEGAELAQQIADFEFEAATKTLAALKKQYESGNMD